MIPKPLNHIAMNKKVINSLSFHTNIYHKNNNIINNNCFVDKKIPWFKGFKLNTGEMYF